MSARKPLVELLTTGAFRARRHGALVFTEPLPPELPDGFDADLAPAWARVRNVALRLRGGELTPDEAKQALLELQAEATAFAEAHPGAWPVSDRALRAASLCPPPRPAVEAMFRGHRGELVAAGFRDASELVDAWRAGWEAWETRHGFAWRGRQGVRCSRDRCSRTRG